MTDRFIPHCFKRAMAIMVVFSCVWRLEGQIAGGQLRGIVLDDETKLPAPGAVLDLCSEDSAPKTLYTDTSDTKGVFQFDSILQKGYFLRVRSPGFGAQWFSLKKNTLYPQHHVWAGPAPSIDTLRVYACRSPLDNAPTAVMKFLVRDSLGNSIPSGGVQLINGLDWMTAGWVRLDSTPGVALFRNIQPGSYTALFQCPPYLPQYYDTAVNRSHPRYFIAVQKNDTLSITTRLTARPKSDARIIGKVMSETGGRLPDIGIGLHNPGNNTAPVFSAATDSMGIFRFEEITQQSYLLKLNAALQYNYPDQWYSPQRKATTLFADDPVMAHMTYDTLFIVAARRPIDNSPSSTILLNALDSNGIPISPGGLAECTNRFTWKVRRFSPTATPGLYRVDSLQAGEYSIQLEFAGYPIQYFSPAGNTANPAHYFALKENDTVRFDTRLIGHFTPFDTTSMFAFVKGRVVDSLDKPIAAKVIMLDTALVVVTSSGTMTDGGFGPMKIPAYKPHYCAVEFSPNTRFYWSPLGMSPRPDPTGILRLLPKDTVRLFIRLATFDSSTMAQLSGMVVDSMDRPVPGRALILDGTLKVVADAPIMSDGRFGPLSILPGKPFYAAAETGPAIRYYYTPGAAMASSQPSQLLTLSKGDSAKIVIKLPLKGGAVDTASQKAGISGSVLSPPLLLPVKGARVVAFTPNISTVPDFNPGHLWSPMTAFTDSSGYYSLRNLPPGEYIVMACADSQNYIAQFHMQADLPSGAKRITLDQLSQLKIDFKLRQGGRATGKVKSPNGAPIKGAMISLREIKNTRWSETVSDSNGDFVFQGLPAGKWRAWAHHQDYFPVFKAQAPGEYEIREGQSTALQTFSMEPGGRITGTFTSPLSLFDSSGSGLAADRHFGQLLFFADSSLQKETVSWPRHVTGVRFFIAAADGKSGTFETDACPAGYWRCVYSPPPRYDKPDTALQPPPYLGGLGWFVLGGDTTLESGALVEVRPFDTTGNAALKLRKGYSIFGAVSDSAGNRLPDYNVSALAKGNGRFFCVAFGSRAPYREFELPGVIDGKGYYINAWADGYPNQFWSPETSTIQPCKPYLFAAQSFVPPNIRMKRKVFDTGGAPPANRLIELQPRFAANGALQRITVIVDTRVVTDFCLLYGKDSTDQTVPLFSAPVQPGVSEYTWTETRKLTAKTRYVAVGKGKGQVVRSECLFYEPREIGTHPDSLWIAVSGTRRDILIEWGAVKPLQTDSVSLFRRLAGEPWKLLKRYSVWDFSLHDDSWRREDSGKTYEYRVELLVQRLSSRTAPFLLDNTFFARLAERRFVGPYERYRTIQSAIDAANDFDPIVIRSGTYRENLNCKKKILRFESDWQYGKPPVLDGGGLTAITVPCRASDLKEECVQIEGLKIQNAEIGIQTAASVSVYGCLFANVKKAAETFIDSAAAVDAMLANPFVENFIGLWLDQCTFIAGRGAAFVAAASARGLAETQSGASPPVQFDKAYITPVYSLSSEISLSRSIFVGYISEGITDVPLKLGGVSPRAKIRDCNFWRTSITPSTQRIQFEKNLLTLDPKFLDTVFYFLPDNSALRTAASDGRSIGYDGRRFEQEEKGGPGPSAVRGLTVTRMELKKTILSWTASPGSERVVRYKVYRAPGDTGFYYVNKEQQWEPKISEDSLFTVIDSFSTTAISFTDTNVVPGKPYLYVVAAIDSSGAEGSIDLPGSVPISSLFTNVFEYTRPFTARRWYMMCPWGAAPIAAGAAGGTIVYRWDDRATPDKLFSQYAAEVDLKPGLGYWFMPQRDTALSVSAATLSDLVKNEAALAVKVVKGRTGWNQIASPLPFPVRPSWLGRMPAWEWDPDSLGYRRAQSLVPWKAYWVRTERDTLLPMRQDTAPAAAEYRNVPGSGSCFWEVGLSLRGNGAWDIENYLGAVERRDGAVLESPEPPPGFGGAQLYFLNAGDAKAKESEDATRLSSLYRVAHAALPLRKLEWTIGVTPFAAASMITVRNMESLPSGAFAFWIDNSRIIDLRNRDSIDIPPHSGDVFGYIVVTANERDIALYSNRFYLGPAFPNPFRGRTSIDIVVPYEWLQSGAKVHSERRRVQLVVFDLAGRVVATLLDGDVAVGAHRIVWNGSNGRERRAPSGMYIVRLSAKNVSATVRIFRVR